jgi:hypothetical protein
MKHAFTAIGCAAVLGLSISTAAAQTLNTVKQRGVLQVQVVLRASRSTSPDCRAVKLPPSDAISTSCAPR